MEWISITAKHKDNQNQEPDRDKELHLITEGRTKFWIVKNEQVMDSTRAGPGNAHVPVFFNPAMEFNRDLSILVVERFLAERRVNDSSNIKLLDGLAGSGARGVRLGREVNIPPATNVTITINDHNPVAFNLIKKNIEYNELAIATPEKQDLNHLLARNRFDYIDIDPFGSPINFLDAGTRMLRNEGILAVTATDTATLFGTYPKTCLRRYDAWSSRTKISHELGVRILVGACVRFAARHNLGLEPLLVHATDHYYRVYLRGIKGRGCADAAINNLGFVMLNKGGNEFTTFKRRELLTSLGISKISNLNIDKKGVSGLVGPLWLGPVFNADFIKHLDVGGHSFGTNSNVLEKMTSLWCAEADAPVGFYDTNNLAAELKVSTPRLDKILYGLHERGYNAVRTHFKQNSFKTDAQFAEVCQVMKGLS